MSFQYGNDNTGTLLDRLFNRLFQGRNPMPHC